MIVFIDVFSNMIKMFCEESKKTSAFYFEQEFDYSLLNYDNKIKAITVFLKNDEVEELKNDKNNQLIFSDDLMGFGTFELPVMKKQKLYDIFNTRFRMCYTNPDWYFYDGYEIERNDRNVVFFYEFAKREYLNNIVALFKNAGVSIKEKNIFASTLTIRDKSIAPYPIPVLVIGKHSSEFIIVKGDKVLTTNTFDYGEDLLLDFNNYLNSGYNVHGDESIRFSIFIKEHIVTREEVNDFNIMKTPTDAGLSYTTPKELRILKEGTIEPYIIKSNFKKFYARLLEIVDLYSKAPWYFPIKEINVISSPDTIGYLYDVSSEEKEIKFVSLNKNIDDYFKAGIINDPMFSQGIKKERKKIDWKAILNMEIGGKKKKA